MIFKLSNMNSASGDENSIADFIAEQAVKYADEVTKDSMENVVAFKKGTNSEKRILIAAHTDEVGLIVSSITDDGYIKFRQIGGIDTSVLLAKKVRIGKDSTLGVIGVTPIHLLSEEKRKEKIKHEDMYIDIGVCSKDEAENLVKKGDYIYFDTNAESFGNGFYKGKAFDDRCGCMILLELMKETYKNDVYFAFTVQEEVGLRGASVVSRKIAPDEAFVIECTTCLDLPFVEEKDISTRQKNGGAITIVDSYTYADKELRQQLFEDSGLQYKNLAKGGNDSGAISINNIKVASISVPARYIHSPVSVISEYDINSVICAMKKYLKGE